MAFPISAAIAALVYLAQPDPRALIPIYEQALAAREQQYGPTHLKTAQAASDLGLYLLKLGNRGRAEALLQRAAAISGSVDDLENLAKALPPPQAASVLEQAAAKAVDPTSAARILTSLGEAQERLRRPDLAVKSYQQAIARQETPARINSLALLLGPRDAEPLFRKALQLQPANHPSTAVTMNNLANVLLAQNKLAEAERLQRSALSILESAFGREHPRVAISCSNLADVLRAKGDTAGAKQFYRRALAIDEKVQPGEVPSDIRNLAEYLEELGEKAEAARLRARLRN